MKKVYYAHPINTYNTVAETRDLELLSKLGFQVFNPNNVKNDIEYKKHGMVIFEDMVKECDCLAFRALPNGAISAGVVKEIEYAVGKPIFEIPCSLVSRSITVEETREYFRDIGYR